MVARMDKAASFDLARLIVFLVVTFLATALLGAVLSGGGLQSRHEYSALFADTTGVTKGDEVRVAGVPVGQVRKVEVHDRTLAKVTFAVDTDVPLSESTQVEIRFRNLVGQRYLVLTAGAGGSGARLEPGATIPEARTKEALDLNVLFNGFKPLFEALSPDDINKLSFELVKVLQGEAGNVETLLATTSSLTGTLADRDELIGDVITNLSEVLDLVGRNDEQLGQTLDTLQQFVTGLKDDRDVILDSIDGVTDLTLLTADLLTDARGPLKRDIHELNRLTTLLTKPDNFAELEETLQIVPVKWTKLANTATYGSFYNFYLCELKGVIVLPEIPALGIEEETEIVLGDPQHGIEMPGAARCNHP